MPPEDPVTGGPNPRSRRGPAADCELSPLPPGFEAAAADVLVEAFASDPTLAWCFDAAAPGYLDRLRSYATVGHRWHVAQGHPVQGAFCDAELVGVLYAVSPHVEPAAEAVRELEAALAAECGAEGAGRFARYNQAVEAVAVPEPAHGIALVGVRRAHQGRAVGSRLVTWTVDWAGADGSSRGVVLDTGNPRNLPFYERHGFERRGEVRVDGLREYVLFRPS
ncbi:MAG: GNAT family N-acetyltransferase [Proteobacteria bacterium]|nr:GNAT family N-acetyltransferase [Pseudomonadota bacterium]